MLELGKSSRNSVHYNMGEVIVARDDLRCPWERLA